MIARSVTIAVLVAPLLLTACSPAGRAWQGAKRENTPTAYSAFARGFPEDRRAQMALVEVDQLEWADATQRNDEAGYAYYLQQHPAGLHVDEAKQKLEELRYQAAMNNGSVGAMEQYLTYYPDGTRSAEVSTKLEEAVWKQSLEANTPDAYGSYVVRYPAGPHTEEAQTRREVLIWEAIKEEDTLPQYQDYLRRYPAGQFATQARDVLETFKYTYVDVLVLLDETWRTEPAKRKESLDGFHKNIKYTVVPWLERSRFEPRLLDAQDMQTHAGEAWERIDTPREDTALIVITYSEAKGRNFEPYGFATDASAKIAVYPPQRFKPLWEGEVKASTGGRVTGRSVNALHENAQQRLADAVLDKQIPVRTWAKVGDYED